MNKLYLILIWAYIPLVVLYILDVGALVYEERGWYDAFLFGVAIVLYSNVCYEIRTMRAEKKKLKEQMCWDADKILREQKDGNE